MKLIEMLELYRNAAAPNMTAIAAEFRHLTPAEQRELLFWMVIDVTNNPTKVSTQHVAPAN